MNGKQLGGGFLVVLIVLGLWVGTAWYRYSGIKEQGEKQNRTRIEDFKKLPSTVQGLGTMPVNGDVRPDIWELLLWPLRNKVTCHVYVEGREWNSFIVDTSDLP